MGCCSNPIFFNSNIHIFAFLLIVLTACFPCPAHPLKVMPWLNTEAVCVRVEMCTQQELIWACPNAVGLMRIEKWWGGNGIKNWTEGWKGLFLRWAMALLSPVADEQGFSASWCASHWGRTGTGLKNLIYLFCLWRSGHRCPSISSCIWQNVEPLLKPWVWLQQPGSHAFL